MIQSRCSIYSHFLKPLHWNIHELWHQTLLVMEIYLFFLFLFAIYLKLTITIYEKLQKNMYTIKNSLSKWLI